MNEHQPEHHEPFITFVAKRFAILLGVLLLVAGLAGGIATGFYMTFKAVHWLGA